jgi:hypothetical protein
MENTKIIQFNANHLDLLEPREYDKENVLDIEGIEAKLITISEMVNSPDCNVDAWTLIYDGRILTCFGYIEHWPGMIEIWQLPSKYIYEKPIVFSKTIKTYIEELAKKHKWHRMQTVAPDDDVHRHWMEWLGFQKEGLLRQYTHKKQDYLQFGRIFKWD